MKFRFCGDSDCPDWILAEINSLSKLPSIKIKQFTQIVVEGIKKPPLNIDIVDKLFSDIKIDDAVDLKAGISCLSFIVSSTIRYNCNSSALHSELQQLGLPREHSTSIKRIIDDERDEITKLLKEQYLKVSPLKSIGINIDPDTKFIQLHVETDNIKDNLTMLPSTFKAFLSDLKLIKDKMSQLNESSESFT